MSKRGWHLLPVCVLVELQNQQSCSRAALEVEPNRVRGILGERTPHLETKSWQRPLIAVRADHARTGHEASLPESKALSCVQLFAPSWPVVHQVPPSMGFPRQEYWSGCHFLPQGIFQTQGSNPGLHCRWILYRLSHQGSHIPLKAALMSLIPLRL